MRTYRKTQSLCLWALVWFVAAIFTAAAAPSIQPQAMEIVCSGTGSAKLFVQTDNGLIAANTASMECPLCLIGDIPSPPPIALALHGAAPHSISSLLLPYLVLPSPQTRPPARAPPVFS